MPTPDFNRVAPFYDSLSRAVFGNSLRRAQTTHLSVIPEQAHVLLIGGGAGWLLEQLLLLRPRVQVTYLEASVGMLRLTEQRISRHPALRHTAVNYLLGNENELAPDAAFDVIITPFLLDLFPDVRLQQLMERLYTALSPAGLWLFSDFWPVQQVPPLWQRLLLGSMYTFFGMLSQVEARKLPDFDYHFSRFPLQELQSAAFYGGMVQAKVYRKN